MVATSKNVPALALVAEDMAWEGFYGGAVPPINTVFIEDDDVRNAVVRELATRDVPADMDGGYVSVRWGGAN